MNLSDSKYVQSFSFGLNEIVMTMLCAISGYVEMNDKSELIYIIFVTGFASIIPDIYAYYLMMREEKKSISESLELSIPLIVAELLSTVIIASPLLFLDDKKKRFIYSIILGIILIFFSTFISKGKKVNWEDYVEPSIVTIVGIFVTYIITHHGGKYVKELAKKYV